MVMVSKDEQKDYICLKWGTLKGWEFHSEKAHTVIEKYKDLKLSMSAMAQERTTEHNNFICELIDAANCDEIELDWEGKMVSKDDAKKYIMEYGCKRESIKTDTTNPTERFPKVEEDDYL